MTRDRIEMTVVDVPDQHRFEARGTDGQVLGRAEYQKTAELVVFTHTEVGDDLEGQGVGSRLVAGALDDVRGSGLAVLPLCPFVKAYIGGHREYADLLYGAPPSTAKD